MVEAHNLEEKLTRNVTRVSKLTCKSTPPRTKKLEGTRERIVAARRSVGRRDRPVMKTRLQNNKRTRNLSQQQIFRKIKKTWIRILNEQVGKEKKGWEVRGEKRTRRTAWYERRSNRTGHLLLYVSTRTGRTSERKNVTSWERGGGGACSAAKPTSKIKLIRLSFSSSFCFSCDFFKKLFLVKLKRACVRSPLTNAPTPIPIPSKEHLLLLLLLLLLVFWLILLSGLGLLTPSVVRQFSSRLGFWSFCHLGDGSK